MRVLHLDDDARATYIKMAGTGGTAEIVEPGEDPGTPSGLSGVTNLYKLTAPSQYTSAYLPFELARDCYALMLESWIYIAPPAIGGAGQLARVMMLSAYPDGLLASRQRAEIFIEQVGADAYKWRLVVHDEAFHSIASVYALSDGVNPYTHSLATGQWFKLVITWQSASADSATDGAASISVYDEDGTTLLGTVDTGAIANLSGPISTVVLYTSTANVAGASACSYYADQVVHDNLTGTDTPGVLAAFIHSTTETTARLRVICDRAVTAATCSVSGATVAAVALDDDDDGRIWEWALSGLAYDTAYTWSVVLDGTTVNAAAYAGTGSTTFTPLPAKTSILYISDAHNYVNCRAGLRNGMAYDRMRTTPTHICMLGDCFTTPGSATMPVGVTYDRATGRLMLNSILRHLAPLTGKVVTVCTNGNHDGYVDGSAASRAYVRAMVPRTVIDEPYTVHTPEADIHVLNEAEYFNTNGDDGYTALATWLEAALATSTAPNQIVITHTELSDEPAVRTDAGTPTYEPTGFGDIVASLHTKMAAAVSAGKRVFSFHGHLHGSNWWVKDGVVYATVPPYRLAATKESIYGDWTNPAGELDSLVGSIDGYAGKQDGSQGWAYSLFTSLYSRHEFFDVALIGTVCTRYKVLDMWRVRRLT